MYQCILRCLTCIPGGPAGPTGPCFPVAPWKWGSRALKVSRLPKQSCCKMQIKTFKKCNNTTLQQYGKQGYQCWSSRSISGSAFSPLPPCLLLFHPLQVFQAHPGWNRTMVGICVGGQHSGHRSLTGDSHRLPRKSDWSDGSLRTSFALDARKWTQFNSLNLKKMAILYDIQPEENRLTFSPVAPTGPGFPGSPYYVAS